MDSIRVEERECWCANDRQEQKRRNAWVGVCERGCVFVICRECVRESEREGERERGGGVMEHEPEGCRRIAVLSAICKWVAQF